MIRTTLCALSLVMAMACVAAADAAKPNILFIFADDLGWKDVGYQGTDFHETPRIDALAASGMVFTNGYSSAGNCQPSRACLISGQYTPRHHVYAVGSTLRGPKNLMRMIPVPNKSGIPAAELSMADALESAGYATGIFGKWHISGKDGAEPADQGFDVVTDKNYPGSGVNDDPKGIFTLTAEASQFMEQSVKQGTPFFCYVPHHAIHSGHQARRDTLSHFENKPKGQQHKNDLYAACAKELDIGVGMLLDKLDELGVADNTLVAFTSDNGGTQQSSQEPLRGNKGSYYEGGIREPFIVRWPGVTRPGSRCDVPVINVDLFPTFAAAAGASVPADKILDGENLRPLLEQSSALKRQSIYWHFPGYLDSPVIRGRDPVFRTRPVSVVRKGDWKLHLYHEEWQLDGGREQLAVNNAVELYNLIDDVGERTNLANSQTEKRDELLDDLLAWFESADAVLPTETNPDYQHDAAPDVAKRKNKRKAKRSTR